VEAGQLSQSLFERLLRLWDAAHRRPALVFVGDFAQLRGVEGTRACESPLWQTVEKKELFTMRRCECPILRRKLELLRTSKPPKTHQRGGLSLYDIKKGHKAPYKHHSAGLMNAEPTDEELMWVFAETPKTTFVTISRHAAARVNELALRHFFANQAPVATVFGDPESNPSNFYGTRQVAWTPTTLSVFVGMRVMFTKNLNKNIDYVNGMEGIVEGFARSGLRVKTATGYHVVVYPWTDEWKQTFLPVKLGYAHTLLKVQGKTLDHMTIYLDKPNVEAAGYVALSRVRHDKDWRYVGNPTEHHFTPATGY